MVAPKKFDIAIPGYTIERQIGRGGMASVYLAIQDSMEREVAVKVMSPALGASDPSFSARFIREAKIVAKMSHPHINAVFDVGVAGNHHYFSMEYVTGGDLKAKIRKGLAPKDALSILHQIASALAYAHGKGYIHRDVKPENVLFRENGTALLTDFGIAKTNDEAATQMTATGAIIGTPHYMSPEQAMGRPLDKRSDLYSLGIMLFEMLTGKLPYTGESAISIGIKHLKDPIPQLPPPAHVYQPLLNKFLAKEAKDRFQSGEEVMTAIEATSTGSDTIMAPRTTLGRQQTVAPTVLTKGGTRVMKPAGGNRRLMLVASVLIVSAAAAAFYIVKRPAPGEQTATAPASATPAETPSPTRNEAEDRAKEIAKLLEDAEKAERAGRATEPADKSAIAFYRKVLALDAQNARAAKGLREIAHQFIKQAEESVKKRDFDRAESLLKQAEEIDANHPLLFSTRLALDDLRKKTTPAAAERPRRPERPEAKPTQTAKPVTPPAAPRVDPAREQKNQLNQLFSRLDELLAPGSVTATRLRLAQELLVDANRQAPGDPRTKRAPGRLAEAYLHLATARAEAKEYKDAENLIRQGLDLQPNHRSLLALQKDVAEKQKPATRPTFGTF